MHSHTHQKHDGCDLLQQPASAGMLNQSRHTIAQTAGHPPHPAASTPLSMTVRCQCLQLAELQVW